MTASGAEADPDGTPEGSGIDAFPKDATFFSSKTAPSSRRNREPQSPSLPEGNTDKPTASSFKKAAPGTGNTS